MLKQSLIAELNIIQNYFNNSSACLTEDDSNFRPQPEMMTVAQHVQHAADSIHWFLDGAFSDAFDFDFEKQNEKLTRVTSLQAARTSLNDAINRLRNEIETKSEEDWQAPVRDVQIMTGVPRFAIIFGINDHTAHHRGALTVYSRLLGKTPEMPY